MRCRVTLWHRLQHITCLLDKSRLRPGSFVGVMHTMQNEQLLQKPSACRLLMQDANMLHKSMHVIAYADSPCAASMYTGSMPSVHTACTA